MYLLCKADAIDLLVRIYEKKSIGQVQALLEQATKDLGELTEQVSRFVDWWGNMKNVPLQSHPIDGPGKI